jgi:hypothetical protein
MQAIGKGKSIVGEKWCNECVSQNTLIATEGYGMKDTQQEKKFKFDLKLSLDKSRREPVFTGSSFYLASQPEKGKLSADIGEMIKANAGVVLTKEPKAYAADTYMIALKDADLKKKPAVPLVTTEFVMTSILRQIKATGKDHDGKAFVV